MTRTIQQLFDLKGKTALVTGGSRGLGLQLTHALGEAGARIMISARKAGELESAAAELKSAGIEASWIAADCAKEAEIHRLADETLQRMGAVDILVNNAGALQLRSSRFEFAGFASTDHDARTGFCLLYTSPSPRDRQKSRIPSPA